MIGAPIGCPGKEITMAVTDKATFILNNEYIEQVQKLNDTQAGQLFRTILLYANEQNVDDPADPMVSMVFSFIRQQMDKDYKKYEETCKKRAENGKKGGRPRKNDTVSCDEPVGEAAHSLPNDAYAEETEKCRLTSSLHLILFFNRNSLFGTFNNIIGIQTKRIQHLQCRTGFTENIVHTVTDHRAGSLVGNCFTNSTTETTDNAVFFNSHENT